MGASRPWDLRGHLAEAWALAKAGPVWVGLGAALANVQAPGVDVGLDPQRMQDVLRGARDPGELAAALVGLALPSAGGALVLGALFFVLRCFATPGWLRWLDRSTPDAVADGTILFDGGPTLGRMIGWRVLSELVVVGGAVVAGLPGLLVMGAVVASTPLREAVAPLLAGLALFLAPTFVALAYLTARLSLGDVAVALEGHDPVGALRRTWALTSPGHGLAPTGWVLGGALLLGVAGVLGVLACGVGLVVTLPVWAATWDLGRVRTWRALTGEGATTS